ncbi:MAG: PorV/PorQ family protein [bacterium]|nr:PorV/PorQ family protein [bacterium]
MKGNLITLNLQSEIENRKSKIGTIRNPQFAIRIISLIGILLWGSSAHATSEDGGLPGYFTALGTAARAQAMGQAYVGLADDLGAIGANAAGLSQIKGGEVSLMHVSLFEETKYYFFGLGRSFPSWSLGGGFAQLSVDGTERTDENNTPGGDMSDKRSLFSFAGSYKLSPRLSAGGNFKWASHEWGDDDGSGMGVDLGLLYRARPELSLGLNLENVLGPKIKREEESDKWPLTLRAGAAYRLLKNALILALDVDKTSDRSVKVHGGTEFCLLNGKLALRAGYDEGDITAGLGIKPMKGQTVRTSYYREEQKYYGSRGARKSETTIPGGLTLDYAVLNNSDLGISHRFSISYRF